MAILTSTDPDALPVLTGDLKKAQEDALLEELRRETAKARFWRDEVDALSRSPEIALNGAPNPVTQWELDRALGLYQFFANRIQNLIRGAEKVGITLPVPALSGKEMVQRTAQQATAVRAAGTPMASAATTHIPTEHGISSTLERLSASTLLYDSRPIDFSTFSAHDARLNFEQHTHTLFSLLDQTTARARDILSGDTPPSRAESTAFIAQIADQRAARKTALHALEIHIGRELFERPNTSNADAAAQARDATRQIFRNSIKIRKFATALEKNGVPHDTAITEAIRSISDNFELPHGFQIDPALYHRILAAKACHTEGRCALSHVRTHVKELDATTIQAHLLHRAREYGR